MTSLRSSTARIFLDRIPVDEHAHVVREAAKALDLQSSNIDFGFAAALLQLHPEDAAKDILVDRLRSLVECGADNQAALVCSAHPELQRELFEKLSEAMTTMVHMIGDQSSKSMAVPFTHKDPNSPTNGTFGSSIAFSENVTEIAVKATYCLHFLSRTKASEIKEDTAKALFGSCVDLLGSVDKKLCLQAKDTLFTIPALLWPLESSEEEIFWARIETLISAPDAFYQTLGFSVWLRWMATGHQTDKAILCRSDYWNAIIKGLRKGDSERRKVALQVLRASADATFQSSELISDVIADTHRPASRGAVQKQYSRFCTVFETVVLGRYLNQVQECEADLDFLCSPKSIVSPVWVYTLLESALEQSMQDSNRKFVGRWVMRSKVRMDGTKEYLAFFRNAFLPWACGGHLFTWSLRKRAGVSYCEHGEMLSTYVSNLLLSGSSLAKGVVDSILDFILSRHGNNFAYSMVYLIEGIGKACDDSPDLCLNQIQLDNIGKIATWAGLPEVSRDYILARSWKLCNTWAAKRPQSASAGILTAASLWDALQAKLCTLPPGSSAHVNGNLASMALEPSRRDRSEQQSIQKVMAIVSELNKTDASLPDPAHLEDVIEDIWSDLEYLEYPKSFLAILPNLVPHQRLLDAALSGSSNNTAFANILATRTSQLLEQSQSRSYLFSPLASAVRRAALGSPKAVELFRLEHFVLQLAENIPVPTIDVQLEEAVIPMLKSLGPEMFKLSYEYYFGPRESHGFAVLLDVVSRLGMIDAGAPQRILRLLLDRWSRQKIPPPSVSPWKTGLQLQVMLLCVEQHARHVDIVEAKSLLKELHYLLAIEPLPRYRYLFEWMIARVLIHHPQLMPDILEELRTKDHHSNPKFLASLMKLGVMLAKMDNTSEGFAFQLATVFISLAASSKIVIRHEAQWQIPLLMDHAKERNWGSIFENAAFGELDEFIRSLERYGDPPLERQIDKLDPVRDHNLSHLIEGPWYELDSIEQRQTSHNDFLELYAADKNLGDILPTPCMLLGDKITLSLRLHEERIANDDRKTLQNIENISRALGAGPGPAALQTKGNAYLETTRTKHENLLVVASLVDNPYNLGGLSRVSEIFGTGKMYIENLNFISNKDFTNVSVSSHKHLSIAPLSAGDISEFVAQKKRTEGFKVVGIEQTDRSIMVGSPECVLPEKCILVMGSEKEGIPAAVLTECDILVEIPQVGITRSLNVQTAAAIVLCEYARQHKR